MNSFINNIIAEMGITAAVDVDFDPEEYSSFCTGDEDFILIEIGTKGCPNERQLNPAIAHELVHACQIASGALDLENLTFNGQDYSNMEYMDRPHEIEAYKKEKELVKRYG